MVDYTLLKQSGVSCGDPNDFRLEIVPASGYKFESLVVNETSGSYATKVTVTLSTSSSGPVVVQHLCDADVVCSPNCVPFTINTVIPNLPSKEEEDDYSDAQDG